METDVNEADDSSLDFEHMKTYHMNWYDTDPEYRSEEKKALRQPAQCYHDTEYLNSYAARMRELGFLGCYNHPYWSLQNYEDYKNLKGFWAMEIYNHGCELDGLYGYHPQSYDEMLRSGQKLFCVASDDNHNACGFDNALCDSFGGYVMIGAEKFSYAGITDALQKGNFYSCVSQDGFCSGPEIYEMYLEDGSLHVKTSPAVRIFVKTMGRSCHRAAAEPGSAITEAVFRLNGQEGYIRLDVQDKCGRHACSNAYWLEDS